MIIIDDRDGSRELASYPVLADRCVLGTLEFGDAMMSGHGPDGGTLTVGVEVKSIHDLLSSISTGRLGGHQIPGMLRSYDRCCLLIYGDWRPGSDGNLQIRKGSSWRTYHIGRRLMPWAYVEGFLLTCWFKAGIPTMRACDKEQAATWLAILDRWLDKPWEKHKALEVWDRSKELAAPPESDPTEELIARVASQLPAIGWDRGWAAAKHFDSVSAMMDAPWEEWKQIPRIGPTIAKAVTTAIKRRKG